MHEPFFGLCMVVLLVIIFYVSKHTYPEAVCSSFSDVQQLPNIESENLERVGERD